MSPVKSAASSPPAPGRSSMMTSRPSFGSRSTSASRSSSSTAVSASSLVGELGLEVGAHLGVALALEHAARVRDALRGRAPALPERGLLAQLLVPAAELRHPLQVGRDGGIGELALDLGERLLDLGDQLLHAP